MRFKDVAKGHALPARVPAVGPSSADMLKILDEVGDAVIIVSRDRRPGYRNRAAEDLLREKWPLCINRGRIACAVDEADLELGRAIDSACAAQEPDQFPVILRDKGHSPVMLLVQCLEPGGEDVLLLASGIRSRESKWVHPLRECFGLTPTEARVAAGIAEGKSISAIAEQRGVAVDTIRTQVKTVAAKLGCARQTQIGAIVRSIPYAALRH